MHYIKKMEMANALYKKGCVKIEKSFFGLKTKILYAPTNSPIVSTWFEYGFEKEEILKHLMLMSSDEILSNFQKNEFLESCSNGHFRLSICFSLDHQFIGIELFEYLDFGFRPIGEIRFAEGDEAEILFKVLIKK